MNLYLVTCISRGISSKELRDFYVVAPDPTSAQELVLDRMRTLNWKWADGIERIQLLASVNTYRADTLLVIE